MEGHDTVLTTQHCARLAHKRGYFQTSDDEDGARGGTSSKGESKSKGKGESKGKGHGGTVGGAAVAAIR